MKISFNWLKSYVQLDLPAEELGDIMTNIGLEVEGMESFQSVKGGLEGVVIGEVLSCVKHPNADKLTLTTVDVGREEALHVVCGAPNVAAGQKVPVATVGTTLWSGDESFTIKKSKIRGELSEGMICAEDELGLGTSHDGIMVLDPETETGTPAADYFNIETDTVFEIGLTPNRIDAASHYGVARDLAAYFAQHGDPDLQMPPLDGFMIDNQLRPVSIEVENPEACPRYSGLTISGVKVEESPQWLRNRLLAIGQIPINNVVDITNFVLHELGQPLHAFDLETVGGKRIIVKTLPEGSSFTTLDEVERKLTGNDLMICNENEGMCIAGVFGGIKSGISETTSEIFLESACFDPVFVRKTARHHGLSTDASFRFERGSDPNMTVPALKRAAIMIREIAGGKVSSDIIDIYPEPVEDFQVELLFSNVARLIGMEIPPDTIFDIVRSLDIKVAFRNETGMLLKIPPYRVDVKREADVIEEILRIYGFNRVDTDTSVRSTLAFSPKPDKEQLVNMISDQLSSNGFFEMKSNSLTRAAYYDRDDKSDPAAVRIFNPLSQDLALMRQNLLFGGLEAVAYNINRKRADLKLYEFGYCYFKKEGKDEYTERQRLGLWLSGNSLPGNWYGSAGESSFYVLKRFVDSILHKCGIDPLSLESRDSGNGHLAYGLEYRLGDNELLSFGKVASELLNEFDIKQEVYAAEIHWDTLVEALKAHRILFKALPRHQEVRRDFSLLLNREVNFESLRNLAFRTEKKLLKKVDLFDVYEGDNIEKGKKSYALTFTLLDEVNTLTDKQIDKAMMKIARVFEKELGAQVRGLN